MIRVAIEGIAAGGDGVGRLADGRAVFVPRSAPGDVVEIDLTRQHRRYARGRIVRLVDPSAHRVEPGCSHYSGDRCGGCQLQHLTPEAQLASKRRIVGDALRRIGGRAVEDPPIVPSPAPWRYRSKITLAVGSGGEWPPVLGFHREGDASGVFPLADCGIASESLMALWRTLRPQADRLPRDLRALVLRLDRDGDRHVIVSAGGDPWDGGALASAMADPEVSYWWWPEGGAPRIVAGKRTGFPALAFEQVNPALGTRIREHALEALGEVEGRVVWDLYGGVGDTARALAARGARVWCVDQDRAAVDWARGAGEGAGITYLAARVEDVLRRLPEPAAVVANPPRGGLAARVAAHLNRWAGGGPGRRMCYVSCDPATLARDLGRMSAVALTRLTAYDLFPQTAHVEVLAVLEGA